MIEPTRPGDEVPEADLIAQRTPIEDTDAVVPAAVTITGQQQAFQ